MINSRKVYRTIEGIRFTFECVRLETKLLSSNVYTKRWYWSYEGCNHNKTCLGGVNKSYIYSSLPYMVKAAKLDKIL